MKATDIDAASAQRRRTPHQSRARFTVNAIVEAARQLMAEQGPQALSTRRIAERAGVSIGSLYQYFPNREAIVARLLEPMLQAAAEQGAERYARQLDTAQFFIEAYCGQIELEKNLASFDNETFAQHQKYLVWDWFTEKMKVSPQRRRENMQQFLREHSPELSGKPLELASFLLANALPSTIDALAAENPELLREDALKKMLAAMVRGILAAASATAPTAVPA